ncbi:hydrogenase maturation peptidase HycI [Methanobacterium petrolearium]|uniref:hydrogenase maturation peptidase HycI n=1 Tax=Methanobacterium petrolearium TaxID=710190 RepID=UPI001FD7FC08|nr:hydrogenase maturation peptidase HycI [Methanobacterium petrolearium]MBP1946111.1 hydrogenase 3 maturation protease [Methanobacterium petrolearium]BDZ70748.1 hydrogenase 3 maturation endopeptidase HyCI [Methanobacterium petrolearium]
MKQFLEDHRKIVIMGIGNEMRGDDSIGSVLAQEMSKSFIENENITIIDGKTVPENFTGTIKRETPSHIILLDAVEMNKKPGKIKLVNKEEIENYNISTHAMPLSFLIKYLESTSSAKIILLGIQPKNMDLTNEMSPEVQTSANYILKLFHALLK